MSSAEKRQDILLSEARLITLKLETLFLLAFWHTGYFAQRNNYKVASLMEPRCIAFVYYIRN